MRKTLATALVVASFWAVDARAQTFTSFDYPGAAYTLAAGVNDSGQILGSHSGGGCQYYCGYLYSGGSFTTIYVPGSVQTYAYGINNSKAENLSVHSSFWKSLGGSHSVESSNGI
jgi:hypothetical protein